MGFLATVLPVLVIHPCESYFSPWASHISLYSLNTVSLDFKASLKIIWNNEYKNFVDYKALYKYYNKLFVGMYLY